MLFSNQSCYLLVHPTSPIEEGKHRQWQGPYLPRYIKDPSTWHSVPQSQTERLQAGFNDRGKGEHARTLSNPCARFVGNPLALRATVQGQLPNPLHGSYDMQSPVTPANQQIYRDLDKGDKTHTCKVHSQSHKCRKINKKSARFALITLNVHPEY